MTVLHSFTTDAQRKCSEENVSVQCTFIFPYIESIDRMFMKFLWSTLNLVKQIEFFYISVNYTFI